MNAVIERDEFLFDIARTIGDPARRRGFLEGGWGGGGGLQCRIEELVSACDDAERFFAGCAPARRAAREVVEPGEANPGIAANAASAEFEEKPSNRIGPYKLL